MKTLVVFILVVVAAPAWAQGGFLNRSGMLGPSCSLNLCADGRRSEALPRAKPYVAEAPTWVGLQNRPQGYQPRWADKREPLREMREPLEQPPAFHPGYTAPQALRGLTEAEKRELMERYRMK